ARTSSSNQEKVGEAWRQLQPSGLAPGSSPASIPPTPPASAPASAPVPASTPASLPAAARFSTRTQSANPVPLFPGGGKTCVPVFGKEPEISVKAAVVGLNQRARAAPLIALRSTVMLPECAGGT